MVIRFFRSDAQLNDIVTLTREQTVTRTTTNLVNVNLSQALTGNMADKVITKVAAEAENTA